MRYTIRKDGAEYGPFQQEEIKELLEAGSLSVNDLAAPEGSADFKPLSEIVSFHSTPNLTPSMINPSQPAQNTSTPSVNAGYTPAVADANRSTLPPGYDVSRISTSPAREVLDAALEYKPKGFSEIFNQTTDIYLKKLIFWVILFLVPIVFIAVVFLQKIVLALQTSPIPYPPSANPSSVPESSIAPGQIIQMAVFSILGVYAFLAAFVMQIQGAADMYDGADISLGELFISVQAKIPKFFIGMILYILVPTLVYIPIGLLTRSNPLIGLILSLIVSIFLMFKLYPLPFIIILENAGFTEWFALSFKLTAGQTGRILGLMLFSFIVSSLTFYVMKYGMWGGLIPLNMTIFLLIMSTVFYKDLVERARQAGKI